MVVASLLNSALGLEIWISVNLDMKQLSTWARHACEHHEHRPLYLKSSGAAFRLIFVFAVKYLMHNFFFMQFKAFLKKVTTITADENNEAIRARTS